MNDEYSSYYSAKSFRDKVRRHAGVIGRATLEKALILYYVGIDRKTPTWAKGVITAALGYLIFPLDVLADVTPFVGYADDAGAIASALAAVALSISKEHVDQAQAKMKQWFGSGHGADTPQA
jgi:uncharacterized membrane protein YkvA (DUF1232 family)